MNPRLRCIFLGFVCAMFASVHAPCGAEERERLETITEIINPMCPLNEYDLSGVMDDLTELNNWYIGSITAKSQSIEILIKENNERRYEILEKLRESRMEEWRKVRYRLRKRLKMDYQYDAYIDIYVECTLGPAMYPMILTPEGHGIVEGRYMYAKFRSESRGGDSDGPYPTYDYYTSLDSPTFPSPSQTETGCFIIIQRIGKGTDLTLTQQYKYTEDYILRKVEEDMAVLTHKIETLRRAKRHDFD